jgi:type II secretory ATPase GspE/PulE/Tfp pilus assembly ATPase PilB-like protein
MSQNARLDEEHATQRRARVLGINYADTSTIVDKQLFRDVLTVTELRDLRMIPLQVDQSNILFGITTTTSQQSMTAMRQRFLDQRIAFAIISETGFHDYMMLYDPPQKVEYADITIDQADSKQLISQVSVVLSQVRADDMLAYMVSQAHNLNASDIHIETQATTIANLEYDKYRVLIGAIASAGNVSTASDEAQQGHIAQKVTMADGTNVDVNVRLETVPTINKMDVVMRLFNMDQSMYTLDRLGLSEKERAVVDDIIAKPSGLVLVVGPTGSGKTTTLYSMLNSLNNDERKIITIEDPVEYQFGGITQIPVHSQAAGNDGSFSDKLRAVLRLDPDIVMVGEIRDMETAKTALQASLTGHLVLSTFHAGSASAALTRMGDVIGENPLFVSAIRLVMAQRLVRRLDDSLKQPYTPSEAEMRRITTVVTSMPEDRRPSLEGLQLYTAGSSEVNPYGFRGQIAIREQFTMTSQLRTLLENPNSVLTSQAIEEAAVASGMRTMTQDAMLKVIAGETSLDEILRVVG